MQLVFSSSCTVYGMVEKTPITEDFPLAAVSPYGRTKLFQEDMYRCAAAGGQCAGVCCNQQKLLETVMPPLCGVAHTWRCLSAHCVAPRYSRELCTGASHDEYGLVTNIVALARMAQSHMWG